MAKMVLHHLLMLGVESREERSFRPARQQLSCGQSRSQTPNQPERGSLSVSHALYWKRYMMRSGDEQLACCKVKITVCCRGSNSVSVGYSVTAAIQWPCSKAPPSFPLLAVTACCNTVFPLLITWYVYVADPCRNQRLFHHIFRLHRCVQSVVPLNFC